MLTQNWKYVLLFAKHSRLKRNVNGTFCSLPRNVNVCEEEQSAVGSEGSVKVKKEPFIKNLLLGIYDKDILTFPEVLTKEKHIKLELKMSPSDSKIDSVEKNESGKVHLKGIIESLSIGNPPLLSELQGNKPSVTENVRLSETIQSPNISLLLQIHNLCVYNVLEKYGSVEQKEKYLSDLEKGKISVAYALSEETTGSDPSSLHTSAVRVRHSKEWLLNGSKTWVTNALNADLFFVFSKCKEHSSSKADGLSVFLVEKNSERISVKPVETSGLEECGIGDVTFDGVSITEDKVIGEIGSGFDIAVELLVSFKFCLATSLVSCLKQLLSDSIKFVNSRKQTRVNLKDCEIVKRKISRIGCTLYALESLLYITAGMQDMYEMDTDLECALVHMFCCDIVKNSFEDCLELLGSRKYDRSFPYSQLYNDINGLCSAIYSNDISKLYISLTGFQFAAKELSESTFKLRKSFNYPAFFMEKVLNNWRQSRDDPKLNLNLFENLHPTLKLPAELLEYCVLRLNYCIQEMLRRHGNEIVNRQIILEIVYDILMNVYVMTSVLSRSSRAYCTGIPYSDFDMKIARIVCEESYWKCKYYFNKLLNEDEMSFEVMHTKLGEDFLEKGCYFISHPLKRNIS